MSLFADNRTLFLELAALSDEVCAQIAEDSAASMRIGADAARLAGNHGTARLFDELKAHYAAQAKAAKARAQSAEKMLEQLH